MSTIAYCKIFPPIGIARVGDSKNPDLNKGWYIGPEFTNDRAPGFVFKDPEGKIKRQAARFRLYGFDEEHNPIREITADEAQITWKVELANKKASWFKFEGASHAMHYFRGLTPDGQTANDPAHIRNARVGNITLDTATGQFQPSADRVDHLEIRGGVQQITGTNVTDGPAFVGKFKQTHEVYLGELMTDDKGRLLVLGGHGVSEAVNDKGEALEGGLPFKEKRFIRNYANNDDWHDDISDGPVTATVVFKTDGESREIPVNGGAWIVVTPPDFAPDVKSVVTLYDVMEETAWAYQHLVNKTTPAVLFPNQVVFERDIKPVFERIHSQRWVNARGLRGHGSGKPGDFQKDSGNDATLLDADLSSLSPTSLIKKARIFGVLRKPAYLRVIDNQLVHHYDDALSIQQAVTTFMPPLAGDEGDPQAGDPSTWLSVTYLQYERFTKWAVNEFSAGDPGAPPASLKDHLDALTRNVLDNCTGGAFYPGIEMTSIIRDPNAFVEAFRLNPAVLAAGDVSKYMAVPWQADFWECQQHWWPAQRPDDVIPHEEFEAIFRKFTDEAGDNYEKVLFNRDRWDRGIGVRSRPSNDYLTQRILPDPGTVISTSMSVENYIQLISTGAFPGLERLRFDSLAAIFGRIAGFNSYAGLLQNPGDSGADLPSPWRLQYLAQEALDAYSGLYFHLEASSPFAIFTGEKVKDIEDLRSEWASFRLYQPADASRLLGLYASKANQAMIQEIRDILQQCPAPKSTVDAFRDYLSSNSVGAIEGKNVFNEILPDSSDFAAMRALEMIQNGLDYLYTLATNWSGDMDMVEEWKTLGFVTNKTVEYESIPTGSKVINNIQIESQRSKYAGKSFRDYFYYLMNIQEYPDFTPYAKNIVEDVLTSAQELIGRLEIFDPNHPEKFVAYSKDTFDAKLQEIYEILRGQAVTAKGWRTGSNRASAIRRIYDNAVFNQCDGAWLRYVANAGTTDQVRALLFDVWSDEIGNGDPSLHHGNLYTHLLGNLGINPPPINSRSYADNPDIDESNYISAVFELAISLHTEDYLPELLGMTLYLEWEVLSLVPGIKRSEYLNIDPHFWEMHVGIDNASNGHGAKAKEAVKVYLDMLSKESGDDGVQEQWKRIWRGFVAFDIAGYGYFGNKDVNGRADLALSRAHPGTPQDAIINLITRKAAYGSLNHRDKKIGGSRINDLFGEPDMFVAQLVSSPYVVPGKPDESKLINYLTTFDGPMYKVFNDAELKLWKDWISWLGKEGNTALPKKYMTKAQAMFILLNEVRELANSTEGHKRYMLEKAKDSKIDSSSSKLTIADFFMNGDLTELMRALRTPGNGWVVPYDPGNSPIVVDFARVDRTMGATLDRNFLQLNNQIGRVVLIKWIEAGCPLVGEDAAALPQTPPPSEVWNGKQLLVQQVGMGAVH